MLDISNFDVSVIYTREDGSFVVNQNMYHVPNEGEWVELYAQVAEYAAAHPECVFPEPQPEPEPEPTPEEIEARMVANYTNFIQKKLDEFAQTRNYDGILSACSYATSSDPQFALEGQYCVTLRDETWRMGYNIIDKVKAGEMEIPTYDELYAMLPVSSAKWPDEVEESAE